jgi:hypothetical protein
MDSQGSIYGRYRNVFCFIIACSCLEAHPTPYVMCARGFFPGSIAKKLIPHHQLVVLKIQRFT